MSTIYEKDALLLREAVGVATDSDGVEYELTTSNSRAPMVKSQKTGRTFVLSWEDIIFQAVDAGINKEPSDG
jgi:hypothetical protein